VPLNSRFAATLGSSMRWMRGRALSLHWKPNAMPPRTVDFRARNAKKTRQTANIAGLKIGAEKVVAHETFAEFLRLYL
jgi:hypothetical protein